MIRSAVHAAAVEALLLWVVVLSGTWLAIRVIAAVLLVINAAVGEGLLSLQRERIESLTR